MLANPSSRPASGRSAASVDDSLAARADASGLRLTARRRKVVAFLDTQTEPLSIDEIWLRIGSVWPGCDRSLIYRTVRLLAEHGLMVTTGLDERRRVYTPAREAPLLQLIDTTVGGRLVVEDEDLMRRLEAFVDARGYRLGGAVEIHVTPKTGARKRGRDG